MTPEDEEKQAEENAAPAGGEQAEASAAAPAPGDKPEGDAAAAENKNADAASDAPAAEATGAEPAGETPKDDEEDDSRPKPPTGSVADLLAAALPDVTMSAYQGMSNVIVEIDPGDVTQVMTAAKEQPTLDLDFLRYLCGVDYEAEGLEVVYHLMSLAKKHEVVIKARLPQDAPKIASVAQIWRAADWHERETRDMFGITFEGHPHLLPLLMPEDMDDQFPLRKDSPLVEVEDWQGDHLPEEGEGGSVTR